MRTSALQDETLPADSPTLTADVEHSETTQDWIAVSCGNLAVQSLTRVRCRRIHAAAPSILCYMLPKYSISCLSLESLGLESTILQRLQSVSTPLCGLAFEHHYCNKSIVLGICLECS